MAQTIGKYEIPENALLGQGQFGKVKAAVHLETGVRYAAKIIKKTQIKTKKDVDTVKKEVSFMKTLNGHPNILNMYEMLEDQEKLYLILELASGGDLFDKIVSVGGFDEEGARVYFKQVMSGLEHCHSKGIVHRDMKPENLLLGEGEVLKISDFGLSNIITDQQQMLMTHCGSEKYAAPEVMQTESPYQGPPVDIWSCGVILYIMVGGAFPFVEATMKCDLYMSLTRGEFQYPAHFSADLKDLLGRMFAIKPEERITLPEIAAHRWLNPDAPAAPKAPEGLTADDGIFGTPMDEEPVYRTLDPDMMSANATAFEEEPVYRSIDMGDESMVMSPTEPCLKANFACKPTGDFETSLPVAEAFGKVCALLTSQGAKIIEADEAAGQFTAECVGGASGAIVRVMMKISADASGKTRIAMKRRQGHCLDYVKMFTAFRPLLQQHCA